MTASALLDLGLADPVVRARPPGDPAAVAVTARHWMRAADDLAASGRVAAAVPAQVADAAWFGPASTDFCAAVDRLVHRSGTLASALRRGGSALERFAAVLADAQADWDTARRLVEADTAAQLATRAQVRALREPYETAVRSALRHGDPRPSSIGVPGAWEPDPSTTGRVRAGVLAADAAAAVERAAREAEQVLAEARQLAWPAAAPWLPPASSATAPSMSMPRPAWTPFAAMSAASDAEWSAATQRAGLGPTCLYGYDGGGFLTGADGRRYPLVEPYVQVDGVRYTADRLDGSERVDDFLGRDPGWRVVHERSGIDLFAEPSSRIEKVLAFLGGTGGAAPVYTALPHLLPSLVISATGHPSLQAGGRHGPKPPTDPNQAPARNPLSSDKAVEGTERRKAVAGAVGVGTSLAHGAVMARHLDDGRVRGYVVRFEEHPDGRTRAILRTYLVMDDRSGKLRVVPQTAWLDRASGRLVEAPISFRWRDGEEVLTARRDWYVVDDASTRSARRGAG